MTQQNGVNQCVPNSFKETLINSYNVHDLNRKPNKNKKKFNKWQLPIKVVEAMNFPIKSENALMHHLVMPEKKW